MQGYPRIIPGRRYVVTSDVFIGWKRGDVATVISVSNKEVTFHRGEGEPWKRMSTSLFRAMFNKEDDMKS